MSLNQFFRSTQFLNDDRFRGRSLVALLLVGLLLAAWLLWFFLAQIAVYRSSAEARVVGPDRMVAVFSSAALVEIEPGQVAQLRLDDFPWMEYGVVPASVTALTYDEGRVTVEFALEGGKNGRIPLQAGLSGTAVVTIGHISPIRLVMQIVTNRLSPSETDGGS